MVMYARTIVGTFMSACACSFVNNTGLMWQAGADFHALLVFAEHRYYGMVSAYADMMPQVAMS